MNYGIIFKGIGGFYYVKFNDSIYECKARGKFKNQKVTPLVGDYVHISIQDEEKKLGMIEEILERKTELLRPTVANVNQAIIVFSIKNPLPNIVLLDKMLVLAEQSALNIVICFNKADLDVDFDYEKYEEIYHRIGYPVLKTCALKGEGIDALSYYLKDKITVFSGPSGVGKSSLLNAVHEGFTLQTGEISEKIKRGKHTTRHSELLELKNGGIVVDTPGFTSLSMHEVEAEDLKEYFPEFRMMDEQCKFDNCMHINEPGCVVKAAVSDNRISKDRYEAYLYILKEINEHRRKQKKW